MAQLVKNPPAMQETLVQFLSQKVPLEKDRLAQMVKNPPAVWEIWVQFLGWEDPLEEGMASHSSILAWRIPTNRAWWATVHGITELDTTEHTVDRFAYEKSTRKYQSYSIRFTTEGGSSQTSIPGGKGSCRGDLCI